MNNLTFGNDRVQYYETVASGSGAGEGFDGADAVQTHMTNSRLTDPEILEWRYPVLLESFGVRRAGGGNGRWHGGSGVERRIRFLEPVTVALLSGHRRVPPYGMAGGGPGALGEQYVERADGRTVTPSKAATRPRWTPTTSSCSAPPEAVATAARDRSLLRRFDRCRCEDLICAA